MNDRRRPGLIGAGSLLAIVLIGCSPDDGAGPDSTLADPGQLRTVAIPAERLTPFCEGIADLDDRLAEVPTGGATADIIIDAYSAIVDDVPPEIRDDFLTVLAALQEGTTDVAAGASSSTSSSTSVVAPGTTVEDFEEGYTPDDSPALRLNAYVQFVCRDGQNNPGPPDTEPNPPPAASTAAPDANDQSRASLRRFRPLRCAAMYPGAHAARTPDKPAVIMAESGWTQTFGELDDAANRLSRLFRSVGLEPGDHVALCLENHPRFIEILFGCEYAGLIYTAASSRLTTTS